MLTMSTSALAGLGKTGKHDRKPKLRKPIALEFAVERITTVRMNNWLCDISDKLGADGSLERRCRARVLVSS
jgi:hypothetical protein